MSFDLEYYETFDCFEKKDSNGCQPMNLTMSKTINNMCIKLFSSSTLLSMKFIMLIKHLLGGQMTGFDVLTMKIPLI